MIIQHNRITEATSLASATESLPDRCNRNRPQDGGARSFVKDLKPLIHHLHILRLSDRSIGIRRSAITTHSWERDAVKVQNWRWNIGGEILKIETVLNNRIRAVDVSVVNQRVR